MIYMIQLKQIATIHVIFFPSLWLQALVKYQVARNDIQDPWLKIPKNQSWQVVVLPLGIGVLDLCTEKSSLVKYLQETALTCLWCYELNSMLDLKKNQQTPYLHDKVSFNTLILKRYKTLDMWQIQGNCGRLQLCQESFYWQHFSSPLRKKK